MVAWSQVEVALELGERSDDAMCCARQQEFLCCELVRALDEE